jgi:transposase
MNLFYEELGPAKTKRIRLAVMDMWKPFEKSTRQKAPQASILYDKFHIMGHLNKALDKIRKSEYARLTGKDRKFVKGQKFALLSHRENLTTEGRKGLRILFAANKRLNTAYILKEEFEQLWDYRSEAWARKVLRELEGIIKMATPQALREVREDDRVPLGRHRLLL